MRTFRFYLVILMLVITTEPVSAYSDLTFELTANTPKLNSLSTVLTMKTGDSAELNLQFAYNSQNAGFSCIQVSSNWDGVNVTCTGTQSKQSYKITVIEANSRTRITLSGSTTLPTTKASYKGPKGKLAQTKPDVTLDFDTNPVSNITLTPSVDLKGKLTGVASIASGFGTNSSDAALTGKMNLKKKSLSWAVNSKPNRLNFTGKEKNGVWSGKLTGVIGPAKVSQSISINLTSPVAASRFHGLVTGVPNGLSTSTDPLEDVSVLIRSDNDGNGSISSEETKEVKTDSKGNFDTTFAVQPNRSVTVDFIHPGYSQTPKVFAQIDPGSDIPINTTLKQLQDMSVSDASAATPDQKLQLDNLPSNITEMSGQVFNPVTEISQFPGEFADSTGNLLISSVFSQIEAKDSRGREVKDLKNSTELRMQIPGDTWNTMRDLNPGNNQIDIPLYYYDEADGQWKRSTTDGWLEDADHNKIAETELTAIKTASFTGLLYGVGNITHLSYWNIDWPIETHGCVTGRLLDANDNPATGAVVTARGITYNGSSAPVTTDSNGQFCIDVMRSEASGEDLNGNGLPGEKNKISLSVSFNGKYYKLPQDYELPAAAASCGSSGCLQLNDVKLTESLEITASLCTVTGKVTYSGVALYGNPTEYAAGDPIPGAWVFGYDSQIDWENWGQCFIDNSCKIFETTNQDGEFSLIVPMLMGLELTGYAVIESSPNHFSLYFGNYSSATCPSVPISIKVDGYSY
jgi:hypothetical protein